MAFGSGIEIGLVIVRGSKLTWFLCRRQSLLVFCVRTENKLLLVWGSIDLAFVGVVEIDVVFVYGPK